MRQPAQVLSAAAPNGEARAELSLLVADADVTLTPSSGQDRDQYDRLLRYVDVGGGDAGLHQLERGLAVGRFDSRTGYPRHDRQDTYLAADAAAPDLCPADG